MHSSLLDLEEVPPSLLEEGFRRMSLQPSPKINIFLSTLQKVLASDGTTGRLWRHPTNTRLYLYPRGLYTKERYVDCFGLSCFLNRGLLWCHSCHWCALVLCALVLCALLVDLLCRLLEDHRDRSLCSIFSYRANSTVTVACSGTAKSLSSAHWRRIHTCVSCVCVFLATSGALSQAGPGGICVCVCRV